MDDALLIAAVVAALYFVNRQNKAAAESISAALTSSPGDTVNNIITTVENLFTPRGIRNNNPGNIRRGSAQWLGTADQQNDADFVQFVSPEYGIRAIGKILDSYSRLGLNTVRGIISRWAPPNENVTSAYIDNVSAAVGVQPDDVVNLLQVKPLIVAAIIQQENGQQPYDQSVIDAGLSIA